MKNSHTYISNSEGKAVLHPGIPERARPRASLGEVLRAARAEAGMGIKEASRESGISTGSISTIEQGKTIRPSLDHLLALSDAYGIDPMTLIEAAGYKLRPVLPEFTPYLRTKYRQLPDEAHVELAEAFQCITAKYGALPNGPRLGEDEQDTEAPGRP